MRLYFRCVGWVVALAFGWLAAAAGLGAGQVVRPGDELAAIAHDVDADSTDVTGGIGAAIGGRALPLTLEELENIFDGIMRVRDAPEASLPEIETAMPRWVALQDLPASVTSDIPMVQGYKFVKLDDRIVLVRPADRSVVAVMPRYKLIMD
jgi:hypothetical protein